MISPLNVVSHLISLSTVFTVAVYVPWCGVLESRRDTAPPLYAQRSLLLPCMSRGVGPEFRRTDVPPLFAETLLGTLALILQLLLGACQLTDTHVACLLSVIHAGQKCSQFCGIGRSWMLHEILHELCLELFPQKDNSGRKIWGTRRLKLDSAVQHCFVVVTSQPASVRWCVVQQPRAPRNWAHWLVHHFHPLFTLDVQVRLREVQRRCNVKRTHDARSLVFAAAR